MKNKENSTILKLNKVQAFPKCKKTKEEIDRERGTRRHYDQFAI